MMRRCSGKLDLAAKIVDAIAALMTHGTGNTGFNGNFISYFEMADFSAGPDDLAGSFMSKDVICVDTNRSNLTALPEVNVGSEMLYQF